MRDQDEWKEEGSICQECEMPVAKKHGRRVTWSDCEDYGGVQTMFDAEHEATLRIERTNKARGTLVML